MGDWHGTGYIVTNPETGAGAYMISGGLNGGALTVVLTIAVLCACFASVMATAMLVWAAIQFFAAVITPFILVAGPILLALITFIIIDMNRNMLTDYMDYLFTGNLDSADRAAAIARELGFISLSEVQLTNLLNTQLQAIENGTLSNQRIEYYLSKSRNNTESDTVILGNTGKYDVIGEEKGYTYFKMDDDIWNALENETSKNYDEIWKVNQKFIDEQIEANKNILLSNDPNQGYYFENGTKRFFQREIDYLLEKGYIFKEYADGLWQAIKSR